jgi:hypothetical protein
MEQTFFGASGDVQMRSTSAVKPSMNVADNGFPTMATPTNIPPASTLIAKRPPLRAVRPLWR